MKEAIKWILAILLPGYVVFSLIMVIAFNEVIYFAIMGGAIMALGLSIICYSIKQLIDEWLD